MAQPAGEEVETVPASAPRRARFGAELRVAAAVVLGLVVLGALLGVLWDLISPTMPAGQVLTGGILRAESPSFMAADVRYAIITASVGVVAGVGVWFLRPARSAVLALALALGGVGGALLTALVGAVIRGGSTNVKVGTVIDHLPLRVQSTGLWFGEGAIALLIFSVLVAFAADDDLGRPDPARDRARAGSVGPQGGLQGAGGYRDGPGVAQQHDFPPQQPYQ